MVRFTHWRNKSPIRSFKIIINNIAFRRWNESKHTKRFCVFMVCLSVSLFVVIFFYWLSKYITHIISYKKKKYLFWKLWNTFTPSNWKKITSNLEKLAEENIIRLDGSPSWRYHAAKHYDVVRRTQERTLFMTLQNVF